MAGGVDQDGFVAFTSQRGGRGIVDAFRYRPSSDPASADPTTLAFFLVERYRLFTTSPDGQLWSIRIHHASHGVHTAESVVADPVTLRLAGFEPKGRAPDHVCIVSPVDVDVFLPEPANADDRKTGT